MCVGGRGHLGGVYRLRKDASEETSAESSEAPEDAWEASLKSMHRTRALVDQAILVGAILGHDTLAQARLAQGRVAAHLGSNSLGSAHLGSNRPCSTHLGFNPSGSTRLGSSLF